MRIVELFNASDLVSDAWIRGDRETIELLLLSYGIETDAWEREHRARIRSGEPPHHAAADAFRSVCAETIGVER